MQESQGNLGKSVKMGLSLVFQCACALYTHSKNASHREMADEQKQGNVLK